MKLETLVTRYKNIGYTPINMPYEIEIASIINWLFITHNIYVSTLYITVKMDDDDDKYLKFIGSYRYNPSLPHSEIFYCDNYFNEPIHAHFDAIRVIYKALKFKLTNK